MASTFSDLKIELIATGEQSGTWGITTNTNLGTALEEAIVGRATANFTTDADLTLTLTDTNATQIARNFILNVTSGVSLSATRNLIVPTIDKPYIIENNTSGSQSIIVKTSAGSGVTVPNGKKVMVYANSTDVVIAQNYYPTLTLGSALGVDSGGTGQTSYTNGQLLIGNTTGNTLTKATLTAGTNAVITNGTGSITIGVSPAPTFTGYVEIAGTSSSGAYINLYEDTDNGTNYVAFKAPQSVPNNTTWTLPNADGTSSQVLTTDGAGNLSWATPSSGGISTGKAIAMAMIFGF